MKAKILFKKKGLLVLFLFLIVSTSNAQQTATIVTKSNFNQWKIEFQNKGGAILEWHVIGAGMDKTSLGSSPYFDFSSNTSNKELTITITSNDNFEFTTGLNLRCSDLYGNVVSKICSVDLSNLNNLKSLDCSENELTDLDISNNAKITYLNTHSNLITSIDLTNNPELTFFSASHNYLTSLDFSKNPNLETILVWSCNINSLKTPNNPNLKKIKLEGNLLTSIDVSNSLELEELSLWTNNIESLDISNNSRLSKLIVADNDLTSLDVSNNPVLETLLAKDNPLTCIQASILQIVSKPYGWNYDSDVIISNDCNTASRNTFVPDDNFEQALIDLHYDDVLDDYVVTNNIRFIQRLEISNKNIKDLTGIEDFYSLQFFDASENNIEFLDISNLIVLKYILMNNNNLTVLEGLNKSIYDIDVRHNELTSLDLTHCTDLYRLLIGYNKFETINLSHNNSLNSFNSHENPMVCVQVNVTQLTNKHPLWSTDSFATYSTDCTYNLKKTYMPDDDFESFFISRKYDIILDNYVYTSKIKDVNVISLGYNDLKDLTGIEDCKALETLAIRNTPLSEINISKNINLKSLDIVDCKITSIDIASNPNLIRLNLSKNQVSKLDVSKNIELTKLGVDSNNLTEIELFSNDNLQVLIANDNELAELDISNNSKLMQIDIRNNPFKCIQVSQEQINSIPSSWEKDITSNYSTNCQSYLSVVNNELTKGLNIYPNPITNSITVESELPLTKVEIYSLSGKKLKEVNFDFNSISIDNLLRGSYFVKVYSENGTIVKKLIKQ